MKPTGEFSFLTRFDSRLEGTLANCEIVEAETLKYFDIILPQGLEPPLDKEGNRWMNAWHRCTLYLYSRTAEKRDVERQQELARFCKRTINIVHKLNESQRHWARIQGFVKRTDADGNVLLNEEGKPQWETVERYDITETELNSKLSIDPSKYEEFLIVFCESK